MKNRVKFLGLGLLIILTIWAVSGCGSSTDSGPVVDNAQTALNSLDFVDGETSYAESLVSDGISEKSQLPPPLWPAINSISWTALYFDNVRTLKPAITWITNTDTSAQATVTIQVTGNIHYTTVVSAVSTPHNDSFSLNGVATVNLSKDINGHWRVDSIDDPANTGMGGIVLKPASSDDSYPPQFTKGNVAIASVNPQMNVGANFTSQATITLPSSITGETPQVFFAATRGLGVNYSSPGRRQIYDLTSGTYSGVTSIPYGPSGAITLTSRAILAARSHFGGIFAIEFTKLGDGSITHHLSVYFTVLNYY